MKIREIYDELIMSGITIEGIPQYNYVLFRKALEDACGGYQGSKTLLKSKLGISDDFESYLSPNLVLENDTSPDLDVIVKDDSFVSSQTKEKITMEALAKEFATKLEQLPVLEVKRSAEVDDESAKVSEPVPVEKKHFIYILTTAEAQEKKTQKQDEEQGMKRTPETVDSIKFKQDKPWANFCEQVAHVYKDFYDDNLNYHSDEYDSLTWSPTQPFHLANIYDPEQIQKMLRDSMLGARSHRITRIGQYEQIANAFMALVTDSTRTKETNPVVDEIYKTLLNSYQQEGFTAKHEKPILPPLDKETELTTTVFDKEHNPHQAIPDQSIPDESNYIKNIHECMRIMYKDRWKTMDAQDFISECKTLIQKIKDETVRLGVCSMKSDQRFNAGNARRLNKLSQALDTSHSLETLTEKAFANGGMGFLSALNNEMMTKLGSGGADRTIKEDANILKLATALEFIKDQYIAKLSPYVDNDPGTDLPVVAVVDQFPKETPKVILLSGTPNYSSHGLTVANLAQTLGADRARTICYTSGTSSKDLQVVCTALQQDPNVKVVNFSAILNKPVESDANAVYESFYNLCKQKHVVIAIGNDGLLLCENDTTLQRDPEHPVEEGVPAMANFIQGFTKWAKDKSVVLDDKFHLTICENCMMDENRLVERSSQLAIDHPLHPYVARVRADCIINEYDHSIESGTSYAAPMVAGAMAASDNMTKFQKIIQQDGHIMTAKSLALLSTSMTQPASVQTPAVTQQSADEINPFVAAAHDPTVSKELLPGLGKSDEGVFAPQLRAEDARKIQQIVPEPGEPGQLEMVRV